MKRLASLRLLALLLVVVVATSSVRSPGAVATGNCGLAQAAFCDTFDNPFPVTNRSGQLDGSIWGVSHFNGNDNLGQGQVVAWPSTTLQSCSGSQTVLPPNDVIICNGQLREAVNDAHSVSVLAMYPKQPFDFAGRTGTVVFDVSNDTHGTHSAWPEFWISDLPSPAPFSHQADQFSFPQNGLGVSFALNNFCPGGFSVDHVSISRDYVGADTSNSGAPFQIPFTRTGCARLSDGSTMNHMEIHVSQNQVDVFASDAVTLNMHKLATIPNANLTFTRGLIWIEDAHYNGDKDGPDQGTHTFRWDNVGFDGPFTYRDFSYDVLDSMAPAPNGQFSLGWHSYSTQADQLNVNTVPIDGSKIPNAQAARLLFNFIAYTPLTTFTFSINGHAHTAPWTGRPVEVGFFKTYAITIPLTDLVARPNNIVLYADAPLIVANVNIVLVNVSGGESSTLTSTPVTSITPTGTPPLPAATAVGMSTPLSTGLVPLTAIFVLLARW